MLPNTASYNAQSHLHDDVAQNTVPNNVKPLPRNSPVRQQKGRDFRHALAQMSIVELVCMFDIIVPCYSAVCVVPSTALSSSRLLRT